MTLLHEISMNYTFGFRHVFSYFGFEGPGSSLKSGGSIWDASLFRDKQLSTEDSDVFFSFSK